MTFDPHAFADWCREKPVKDEYSSINDRTCALAQFGFPGVVWPNPAGVPMVVYQSIFQRPLTFGALADRLAKMGY